MSLMAIINPGSLLANELKELLGQRPDLCSELRLLTSDEEEVGVLTEALGGAALVQTLDVDSLSGVALAFVCGDPEAVGRALEIIPGDLPTVVVSPAGDPARAICRVAGSGDLPATRRLDNPHPAVITLAHLLDSMRPLGPSFAAATVILPASVHDQSGLDELFAQTRSLITFSGERTEEVFGHQLAFNILPVQVPETVIEQLRGLCGDSPPLSLQLLQGSVFHGLSISLAIGFAEDPGADSIRSSLVGHPWLDLAASPETLGPVDGATVHSILVGAVTAAAPGTYWIWAVADNLTRGGALNAIELAEELLAV